MNKKGLSTWATVGSVVMLGLMLMVGFSVYGSTNEGVGSITLSSSCFAQDFDNDTYSNAIESSNLDNLFSDPDSSCPCDPPKYSRNIKLNPEIWDSANGEGPYQIFDYDQKVNLQKTTSIANEDYVFLMWYFANRNNLPETFQSSMYFKKIQSYMRENINFRNDITYKTFCPGNVNENDCTEMQFKMLWFEDADPSPVEFEEVIVCATGVEECKDKMQTACANKKVAKDSGKV